MALSLFLKSGSSTLIYCFSERSIECASLNHLNLQGGTR
jgi:hypothetical protein